MPFSLRKVEDLAEELGKTPKQVQQLLASKQVPVKGGYFDAGALESVNKEPDVTNIKAKSKDKFTMSPTDGIGAMKAVLDKANVDITRHMQRRANYLTCRNAKGQRQQIKVYTTQRARGDWHTATFNLRGFLSEGEPATHFMFICYEGPIAWILSKKQLAALHAKVKKAASASDMCRIPKQHRSHPHGALTLYLDPSQENYLLSKAGQIGL